MSEIELPCFPITDEVAAEVRTELQDSPDLALEEKESIELGDEELAAIIYGIQGGLYAGHQEFVSGVVVAHRILRRQAEAREMFLPSMPSGMRSVYMQDYLENAQPKGLGLEDYLVERGKALEVRHKSLYSALANLAGIESDGIFIGGGALVAFLYEKYYEGEELERKFS